MTIRKPTISFLWLSVPMLLLGCSTLKAPTPEPTQPPITTGVGPGITIADALRSASTEPLLINGFVVIDPQGDVRFCSLLGESDPPTCEGNTLAVRGLPLEIGDSLDESGGVQWSAQQIQLLGMVENGTLEVSPGISP